MERRDPRIIKIAKDGQLQFGYVDWDTELPHTKEKWLDLSTKAFNTGFKAGKQEGRKEVVEWINKNIWFIKKTEADSEWQQQLKEWGLGG